MSGGVVLDGCDVASTETRGAEFLGGGEDYDFDELHELSTRESICLF